GSATASCRPRPSSTSSPASTPSRPPSGPRRLLGAERPIGRGPLRSESGPSCEPAHPPIDRPSADDGSGAGPPGGLSPQPSAPSPQPSALSTFLSEGCKDAGRTGRILRGWQEHGLPAPDRGDSGPGQGPLRAGRDRDAGRPPARLPRGPAQAEEGHA